MRTQLHLLSRSDAEYHLESAQAARSAAPPGQSCPYSRKVSFRISIFHSSLKQLDPLWLIILFASFDNNASPTRYRTGGCLSCKRHAADVISPKNNVESPKIRQLLSFEDADPKPKDGSRRTVDVAIHEEERFGVAAFAAARTGGGASTNPTPVTYPTPTPSLTESSNGSDDDDEGFWESFKDWLFDDDSD
ncbi:hypothetical protein P3T76_014494 [Phytophthora citrophthora]|uniref:Uncharacterized protein n=1 Tax=Phytophthora citrophthora TaxID=4793 RepID=A0AAD9G1Z3_9STRA|nr:hypothetical protein P3T76_014494 [Phytophthora citrophthora]